jgi:hypothetical protein
MNSGKRAGSLAAVFAAVLCVVGYLAYFGHVSVVPKQAVGGVLIGPVGPPLNGGTPSTPAPGTPAYNPSWYAATNIYLDHSGAASTGAGNDSNNCTALATPCLTIAEVYRRYGSHYASLNPNQVTTLNVVVGQTLAQGKTDPYGVIGFTAPGNAAFVLNCMLAAQGPTFAAGAVTAISRANPGNDYQVQLGAGVDAGAAPVAGNILYDSTVSNGSYAFIDSMSANLATLTAPHTGSLLTTPTAVYSGTQNGASWNSGDTLQVYTQPTIYVDAIATTSALLSNVGSNGYTWVQGCNFGDLYNVTGVSPIAWAPIGISTFSLVRSDAQVVLNASASPSSRVWPTIGTGWFNGGVTIRGDVTMYGGAAATTNGDANGNSFEDQVSLQHDIILHGNTTVVGYVNIKNAHVPSGALLISDGTLILSVGTAPELWGAGTVRVDQNSALVNRTGTTWTTATAINSMVLTNAAVTTGSEYNNPSAGLFTNGINITVTNLDDGGHLMDPKSGARYTE